MFAFVHNKKHLLVITLIGLTFFGVTINTAHGQVDGAVPIDFGAAGDVTGAQVTTQGGAVDISGAQAAIEQAAPTAAAPTETPKGDGGGVWSFLGNLVLSLGGAIASLGGWLLDGAIDKFVIHIADGLHTNEPLGMAISTLWGVVRDIVNLVFIFGFVYIGIRTIIDPSRAQTKSFLSQLIVAALLVNFSLFFVKFVIDIANVTSLEIYNLIGGGQGNIAQQFASQVGVPDWFTSKDPEQLANLSGDNAFVYYIMAALFLIIAGFTFAAGAFLLVSRYIVLILLMIFSPLIFAAMVFPQLGKIGGGLVGRLINYAFMAPAYLFLLYLSLSVVIAANPGTAMSIRDVFAGGITGSRTDGDISIILVFFIGIGLLIASLQAAKALGVVGSEQTLKFGKFLRQRTQGYVGRATVGTVGEKWAKSRDEKGKSTTSALSTFARGAADMKFGSSQSRTQTVAADKQAGRIRARNKEVTNIQQAIEGYAQTGDPALQIASERLIAQASNEQILKLLDDNKPGSPIYNAIVANMTGNQHDAVLKAKAEDFDDEQKETFRTNRRTAVKKKIISNAHAKSARGNNGVSAHADDDAAYKAGLRDASTPQLQALGTDEIMPHVADLKTSQYEDYRKSNQSETENTRLKDARESELTNRFNQNPASVFTAGLKDKDAAKLPDNILKDPNAVPYLSGAVLRKILEEDTLSPADRTTIVANITAPGAQPHATAMSYLNSPHGSNFA